ncbi:hypothetical protein C6376_22925 [Streptomyces sp. P3]|nr:hypothetical protein C6376_22925 [Streptomyces sp. P3]
MPTRLPRTAGRRRERARRALARGAAVGRRGGTACHRRTPAALRTGGVPRPDGRRGRRRPRPEPVHTRAGAARRRARTPRAGLRAPVAPTHPGGRTPDGAGHGERVTRRAAVGGLVCAIRCSSTVSVHAAAYA